MNSFNHYSLGSVGLWFYTGIGGIEVDPAQPGYKHFVVAPQLSSKLQYAKVTVETPYGLAASSWRLEKGEYVCEVTVPPNTTADWKGPSGGGEGVRVLEPGVHRIVVPSSAVK